MELEIDIEDWPAGDWEALAARAAQAAGRGSRCSPTRALR